MRFSSQFLDELRARLPVSDVVRRRVQLKKSGNEWRGLSPFNKEKTPSFFVNDQKSMWFDFSAGKNGNIFDFLMLTEGLSFPEAVERLAEQAGLPLPKSSAEEVAREQRRNTVGEVVELAARFFEATLASRAGARARGYLANRGIGPTAQLKFRIGYAPAERFALKEHLGTQVMSSDLMVEAGLLVAGDEIPVPYDRFRDRIMFPITDARSRVIAFGGRALENDAAAKYLNSPETSLFHKGATLYNLAAARAAAHKGAQVIAVEGYVDVMAMVQAGYEGAVAPLGTALTRDQLLLLWKIADEPMLCFDGDQAGRRAAYRAIDLALPLLKPGKSLKFASLPQGHDPDELLRGAGREAMEEVISAALPLAKVLWTRETEASGLDTPERRAAFEVRLGQVIASIADDSVRKHYNSEFGERIRQLFARDEPGKAYLRSAYSRLSARAAGVPRRASQRDFYGWSRNDRRARNARSMAPGSYAAVSSQLSASPVHRGHRAAVPRREALILQAVLNHPWLLHDHLEDLAAIDLRHSVAARVKAAILDVFAQGTAADANGMLAELGSRGLGDALGQIQGAITTFSVWGANCGAAPEDVLTTWKQLIALHHQSHSLARELREAEFALAQESSEANYSWLQDVKARLAALEGREALIEGFGASSGRPVLSL